MNIFDLIREDHKRLKKLERELCCLSENSSGGRFGAEDLVATENRTFDVTDKIFQVYTLGTGTDDVSLSVQGGLVKIDLGTVSLFQIAGLDLDNAKTRILATDGSGNVGYINRSAIGSALSAITAATATNTINNLDFAQVWNWNTLSSQTALTLATNNGGSSSTQVLLKILSSGANGVNGERTEAAHISNVHTGVNAVNVGLYVKASGATINRAIEASGIIYTNNSVEGSSGIFTTITSNGINPNTASLYVCSATGFSGNANASHQVEGSASTNFRISIYGDLAQQASANAAFANLIIAPGVVAENTTGTHPLMAGLIVKAPIVSASTADTTNTATVYIESAPICSVTGGENNALWIKSGQLKLAAGVAAVGGAPLKFVAGTNLTTPEDGTMEFDGANLYFTVGGTRKTVTLV